MHPHLIRERRAIWKLGSGHAAALHPEVIFAQMISNACAERQGVANLRPAAG